MDFKFVFRVSTGFMSVDNRSSQHVDNRSIQPVKILLFVVFMSSFIEGRINIGFIPLIIQRTGMVFTEL